MNLSEASPAKRHSSDRWRATLNLSFRQPNGGTAMIDNTHSGPLRVQRTFKVEDGSRHVYILHPPGGYVAGDIIDIQFDTGDAAHVVATSPGAAKFYRCEPDHPYNQTQTLTLRALDQSLMEWLPQETILFKDANAKLATDIHLAAGASFIGWEISCLGRTASGENFGHGQLDQEMNLYRDNVLMHRERIHLGEDELIQARPWGLNEQPVFGTLIAAFSATNKNGETSQAFDQQDQLMQVVERLRDKLAEVNEAQSWSITTKAGVILVRYLGAKSEDCKNGFNLAREQLLKNFFNIDAARPRIWAT